MEDLINGLEMGKLGDFAFYMDKNAYKKISETITRNNATFKPLLGQKVTIKTGGYDRKITLNGVLVVQPLDALKPLKEYAMDGSPIRFTTIQDDIEVEIKSINTVKEQFLDNGSQTVTTYNLSLEEVYNDI